MIDHVGLLKSRHEELTWDFKIGRSYFANTYGTQAGVIAVHLDFSGNERWHVKVIHNNGACDETRFPIPSFAIHAQLRDHFTPDEMQEIEWEDWGLRKKQSKPKIQADENAIRAVYFIQPEQGGLIKIGWADNPKERLTELQRMSPVRLVLLAVFLGERQDEFALHRQFAEYRKHGEWFSPSQAILDFIEEKGVKP